MKTQRRLCIALFLLVLAVGCGKDKDSSSSSNTVPTTPTTAISSANPNLPTSTSVVQAGVVQNVTDGALCPTPGALGTGSAGRAMVCGAGAAADTQPRWRPA